MPLQRQAMKKFTIGGGAILAAAVLLLGGVAIGYALNGSTDSIGDDDDATPSDGRGAFNMDGHGEDTGPFADPVGVQIDPAPGMPEDSPALPRGPYTLPSGQNFCPAPVGDIVEGNTIDPGRVGAQMNLLGQGFELQHIALRALGECNDNRAATSGELVIETGWLHAASGQQVLVMQGETGEPIPNVRQFGTAQFWDGGYQYGVFVPRDDDATDLLDTVVAQLAPSIGPECFFVHQQGSWEDLAGLGIGDPRPAIPGEFEEIFLNVSTFAAPNEGCPGAGMDAPSPGSFNAGFAAEDINGEPGRMEISAAPAQEARDTPGYIHDTGIRWNDGEWSYRVYAHGLDREALIAIAEHLDPSLDVSQLEEREEQPQPGIREPAPDDVVTDRAE